MTLDFVFSDHITRKQFPSSSGYITDVYSHNMGWWWCHDAVMEDLNICSGEVIIQITGFVEGRYLPLSPLTHFFPSYSPLLPLAFFLYGQLPLCGKIFLFTQNGGKLIWFTSLTHKSHPDSFVCYMIYTCCVCGLLFVGCLESYILECYILESYIFYLLNSLYQNIPERKHTQIWEGLLWLLLIRNIYNIVLSVCIQQCHELEGSIRSFIEEKNQVRVQHEQEVLDLKEQLSESNNAISKIQVCNFIVLILYTEVRGALSTYQLHY